MSTRNKGDFGESLAENYLKKNGYRIICRNYVGKNGEIDIISEKEGLIVFTEVKLRETDGWDPAKAVNQTKRNRIIATANEFLKEYQNTGYVSSLDTRFDVACVGGQDEKPYVKYIKNAFC
jgi:uncharacterized protein (TIGR00252 family)